MHVELMFPMSNMMKHPCAWLHQMVGIAQRDSYKWVSQPIGTRPYHLRRSENENQSNEIKKKKKVKYSVSTFCFHYGPYTTLCAFVNVYSDLYC
jgi:hypothetical protein